MTATDEIKSRLDILDIVGETVKLRRAGKNYTGFCPFHSNTHTPAFVVFPETGTWRCFGQCNEGGDLFKFVMKKEGWDFSQTLKVLAERAGVVLRQPTPEERASLNAEEHLAELLEEAARFYHQNLTHEPQGMKALEYLHGRGIRDETIQDFLLGYALDSWDAGTKHLVTKGYALEDLSLAGLLSQRDGGGTYDRFRNRIMIPIRDASGKMAGFGARILDPNDVPKFLNSPQTSLFDKGRLLYGLDKSRRTIRSRDQAVIVEGYLDVIALHQAGFSNAVSPMGTALTEEQIFLIKKFSHRLVLAMDADAAGEKATLRGLEIARTASDHDADIVFNVNGLMQQVRRLNADIRVTTLPEGKDPDEVVNEDPGEWEKIINQAKPLVIHVMESLAVGKDMNDPRTRAEIAGIMLPLIQDVMDPVERDSYRQRLARMLRVDESTIRMGNPASLTGTRRGAARRAGQPTPPRSSAGRIVELQDPVEGICQYLLAYLAKVPDRLFTLDRMLALAGLPRMEKADFPQTSWQHVFGVIRSALEQDQLTPEAYTTRIISEQSELLPPGFILAAGEEDVTDEDIQTDLYRQALRLREMVIKDRLTKLRFLMQDLSDSSTEGGEVAPEMDLIQKVAHENQVLKKIQLALSALSAPKL